MTLPLHDLNPGEAGSSCGKEGMVEKKKAIEAGREMGKTIRKCSDLLCLHDASDLFSSSGLCWQSSASQLPWLEPSGSKVTADSPRC